MDVLQDAIEEADRTSELAVTCRTPSTPPFPWEIAGTAIAVNILHALAGNLPCR
jgi:hypothetical protein